MEFRFIELFRGGSVEQDGRLETVSFTSVVKVNPWVSSHLTHTNSRSGPIKPCHYLP